MPHRPDGLKNNDNLQTMQWCVVLSVSCVLDPSLTSAVIARPFFTVHAEYKHPLHLCTMHCGKWSSTTRHPALLN